MSNVYEIGREKGREHDHSIEASTWIAKLDKGLSTIETDTLKLWMQADPKNETELLAMARMWDKMDALSRLSEVFPRPVQESAVAPRNNYWVAVSGSVVVVALIAFMAVVGVMQIDHRTHDPALVADTASYETAVGGLSKIELSDGSQITLNTDTRVEVSFNERERLVRLERGEVHIDVAHDPSRPLSVLVRDRIVQAVGTAFSVKIDDSQQVEVIVTDSRVKVSILAKPTVEGGGLSEALSGGITGASLLVAQGERIVLDDSSEAPEVLEPEEIEVQLSWRDGNLIFRGESLAVAAAEVGRYTPVEFVFVDEGLQKVRVAGFFKAGDVTGFLSNLEANFDITYERVDDQTILLSAHRGAGKDMPQ